MFGSTEEEIPLMLQDHLAKRKPKQDHYYGKLFAAPLGKNMEASLCVYTRMWSMLTTKGDKCGDLLSGSGTGTLAALLMERNCLAIDNQAATVISVLFIAVCDG